MELKLLLLLLTIVNLIPSIQLRKSESTRKFPEDFQFGVATSAYQIEGSWNLSDKGQNIWDYLSHYRNNLILDRSTGDVACDSVRLYKTDVQMLKYLGVDFYRFSISWSRILPTGFTNKVSKSGIAYYNNLIDALINNGIRPVVTLYHWDLPQRLQDLGGWINPAMAQYFEDYARVVFSVFGDRVKEWLTFNEPWQICVFGYGQKMAAPALGLEGVGEYLCGHTLLKAHARGYHLYDKVFKPVQRGRISFTINVSWYEPKDNNTNDLAAAERKMQFDVGWFTHPIYSSTGDYPQVMKDLVEQRSLSQGLRRSRLPSFSPQEVGFIRGTFDFFGVNHYTTNLVQEPPAGEKYIVPSFDDDCRVKIVQNLKWAEEERMRVVPWGLRKVLNWIKQSYDSPEVVIFENGFLDQGSLEDQGRVDYYRAYLNAVLDAIEDGVSVTAYTAWSLMDNFEWLDGYGSRFGLYHVDFKDPNRTRTAKASAKFYKDVMKYRYVKR